MLRLTAPAIVCSARAHGETGVIVRLLTEAHGLIAGYVAGGRGRNLRPVLIPGNEVSAELSARSDSQLLSARLELVASRGPWLGEPLASAAISWLTALTAAALPERQAFPALWSALSGALEAVCAAPSARGWVPAIVAYEVLLLRELGYGGPAERPDPADLDAALAAFDRLRPIIATHALADRFSDVMGARAVLRERLGKIA